MIVFTLYQYILGSSSQVHFIIWLLLAENLNITFIISNLSYGYQFNYSTSSNFPFEFFVCLNKLFLIRFKLVELFLKVTYFALIMSQLIFLNFVLLIKPHTILTRFLCGFLLLKFQKLHSFQIHYINSLFANLVILGNRLF